MRQMLAAVLACAFTHVQAGDMPPLWELGKADGSAAEFALAPGNYTEFSDDGFFVVGHSDPKKDWPYVHPGPLDDWAGGREHSFSIVFGIKAAVTAGTCRLVLDLLDTHMSKPPKLSVRAGGQKFEQQLPAGGSNDSVSGQLAKGKPHRCTLEFPAAILKAGNNQIDIVSLDGSWFLYDRVALEVPPGVESAPAEKVARAKPPAPTATEAHITVDAATVVNTMRGGIGASWHAIEEPIPVVGGRSHGGSGWGGYPPAEDDAAWQQIGRHARWLGFDWNRVEIEQRIYEPERRQFTFDSAEMKILYRILDGCEKNKADVFFQQMWSNAKWIAFPQWRDDPVWRVHSGPNSMEDFGEGLATLIEHLVKKKGYTCIKWICITNEPGFDWSWWNEPPNKPLPLKPGLAAVRKALDARGIAIPLSGPDMSWDLPPCDPKRFDFHELLGAYDFHSYGENFDWKTNGQMARIDKNTADWCAFAHKNNKAFFVSEFGTMANGWGGAHAGPSSLASVIKDAQLVVRRLNAGADGFNRWSFLNRGDLDGQWQFVETWDPKTKSLLKQFAPHANTYFMLGLLSRFTAKYSAVLASSVDGGKSGQWQRVFAAALRSPQGHLTLAVVNDAPNACDVSFDLRGVNKDMRLYRYSAGQAERDRTDVMIEPQAEFALPQGTAAFKDRVAPMSVTVYSTYKLAHAADGVIAE
jgi:hypothetical protein